MECVFAHGMSSHLLVFGKTNVRKACSKDVVTEMRYMYVPFHCDLLIMVATQ